MQHSAIMMILPTNKELLFPLCVFDQPTMTCTQVARLHTKYKLKTSLIRFIRAHK